jgi:hypothetical protein
MVVMTAPVVPGGCVAEKPLRRRAPVVVATLPYSAVPQDHPDGEEPA